MARDWRFRVGNSRRRFVTSTAAREYRAPWTV